MALTYKAEWELRTRKENQLVARLKYVGSDFPWMIYTFEPTDAFETVRHLFDEERARREQVYMNADDMNAWGKQWQAVVRSFRLVAVGETIPAAIFNLRIEGNIAYLNV